MATVYPGYHSTPNTSNITLGSGGSGTVTVSGAGNSSSILMSGGAGTTWASTTASNNARISAKGQLHIEGEGADLIMNGVSLKGILDGITNRLSILQPKPELLAKYDNLREAYEHYKTLEALLHETENDTQD
jgi:hypothetical protein